jgi:hypothetical protein
VKETKITPQSSESVKKIKLLHKCQKSVKETRVKICQGNEIAPYTSKSMKNDKRYLQYKGEFSSLSHCAISLSIQVP